MNILADYLPEAVEIDGETYDLNTDFSTGVNIMIAFEDADLTLREKMAVMVQLLYKDIPDNMEEACRLAVKFLNCGEEETSEAEPTTEESDRLYSFGKDAKYIYSAIQQSHGIDLESVPNLHWWKFSYMFLDLDQDCMFMRIIDLRRKRREGKLSKEEEKVYSALRHILDLPQQVSSDQKLVADEFMHLLNDEQ